MSCKNKVVLLLLKYYIANSFICLNLNLKKSTESRYNIKLHFIRLQIVYCCSCKILVATTKHFVCYKRVFLLLLF